MLCPWCKQETGTYSVQGRDYLISHKTADKKWCNAANQPVNPSLGDEEDFDQKNEGDRFE